MSVISLVVTLYSLLEPQIAKKRNDQPEEVTEGLFALSCGPDLQVRFSASSIVNGVRYNTVDHEKYLQTKNSGVLMKYRYGKPKRWGSEWEPIKILLEGDRGSKKMNSASNTRLRLNYTSWSRPRSH
jgi:hypothetical protein